MRAITQETSAKTVTASEPKSGDVERGPFISLDEFYEALSIPYSSSNNNSNSKSSRSEEVVIAEPEPPKRVAPSSRPNNKGDSKEATGGEAQKKFGSAKAISSDQYFQDNKDDDSVSSCRPLLFPCTLYSPYEITLYGLLITVGT